MVFHLMQPFPTPLASITRRRRRGGIAARRTTRGPGKMVRMLAHSSSMSGARLMTGAALLGPAVAETTYKGYLVDNFCYERAKAGQLALDGSDIIKEPWKHTIHCLRDPPQCRESGYYVAYNKGEKTGPRTPRSWRCWTHGRRSPKTTGPATSG